MFNEPGTVDFSNLQRQHKVVTQSFLDFRLSVKRPFIMCICKIIDLSYEYMTHNIKLSIIHKGRIMLSKTGTSNKSFSLKCYWIVMTLLNASGGLPEA
jgi:hypothetical protein